MAGETVQVEGLGELLKRLEALPRELSGKRGGPVRKALGRAARLVRDEVKRNAPRKTGNLQANIIAALFNKERPAGVSERYVVSVRGKSKKYRNTAKNRRLGRVGKKYQVDGDAFYWKFLEFGTSKMPARPFIQPAFAASASKALGEFEKTLGVEIDRVVRKLGGG